MSTSNGDANWHTDGLFFKITMIKNEKLKFKLTLSKEYIDSQWQTRQTKETSLKLK